MNRIKRTTLIALLGLALIPMMGSGIPAEYDNAEEGTTPCDVSEKNTEEEALGLKYADGEVAVHSGPNIFEDELVKIERDEEIAYFQVMANGWIRIIQEDQFGYIDGNLLRDEKVIPRPVVKKQAPAPKAQKQAPAKKVQAMTSFKISFYTDIPGENGGYSTTASGKIPKAGMVASNVYAIGTRIYLEGYGEMVVEDRGGKHFNSADRLDVFVQRKSGESDANYRARAMNLGRQTVKGYIVK